MYVLLVPLHLSGTVNVEIHNCRGVIGVAVVGV
ncbi:hypothetical protein C5167_049292 [Papaver somniferum]|uniref:Uncharacterized protein n=1 Tax=Papaver somniferum TaxID=3469 RepID=A0A4Y7KKE5_PAPSO|nr:hypothetical protein C5167_049292 [Papaver somniferum]